MIRVALALSLAALPVVSAPVSARCSCAGVANIVRDAHVRTRTVVNDHTTQVGDAIIEAILRSTQQLSAYEERTAASQMRVTEGSDANAVMRERQKVRAMAEGGRYDPAPSACIDLSGVMSMGGGAQAAEGPGGNDVANTARNRARGNGPEGEAVRLGGLALAQQMIAARDAHANVGGVLDPTSDVRLLTENITLDTTNGDVAAAFAHLVNNVVDPLPARPIAQTELTSPAAYAQVAARQIELARRSAAHATFAYYGDLATPIGGGELADWARKAATPAYGQRVGDKVSTLQAIDVFVHSRFANPEWHQQLAKMAPEAVMREIALAEALSLHVQWMQFQLSLRDAVVGAAHLATDLDGRAVSSTAGGVVRTLAERFERDWERAGVINVAAEL